MNRRWLLLLLSLAALSSLAACGDTLSVKYGGIGETCDVDTDCGGDLLCYRSHCVDPADLDGTGPDHGASCAGVCDYIGSCNIDEVNCESDCTSETEGWTATGKRNVFECLLDLSCDELGQPTYYDNCKELRNGAGQVVPGPGQP